MTRNRASGESVVNDADLIVVATWNARRSLGSRSKRTHAKSVGFLDQLGVDLAVIPEYGRGGFFRAGALVGDRGDKRSGLAIYSYNGTVQLVRAPTAKLPCVLAATWQPSNLARAIRVLALWSTDYDTQCLLTTWFALDEWQSWLADGPAIVIGDLNQSAKWHGQRPLNFADIVERLDRLALSSAYHKITKESFGAENRWTYRGTKSVANTDYVFISPHFETVECEVVDAPSHHRAVKATVRLKS